MCSNNRPSSVLQGVSAYGGARSISVIDCHISNMTNEGVLSDGGVRNASIKAQAMYEPRQAPGMARDATESAQAWAAQTGAAPVSTLISGCTIVKCRTFGISIDHGCRATVQGTLLDSNAPCGIQVKGESHAKVCLYANQRCATNAA